jgi:protein O-mannosyl-transferase
MAKSAKPTRASVGNNSPRTNETKPSNGASPWLVIILVLVATAITFSTSLGNKFVNWDDDVNIVENENTSKLDFEHVKAIFTSDVIGNYNPLPILTLAIERHFVGLEGTWLYHWTNLFLHLFCVFFVFKIVRALGLNVWAAGFCALLFGIHPMRVESVAWVTERKDVLFAAFYLPAFYIYIKYVKEPENRKKYYAYILVLFALALLSKVQAVALPLSMLAVDYYLRRFDLKDIKSWFKLILEKIPFFLMALAIGVVNVIMLSKNSSIGVTDDVTKFTFIDRLLIGAYSFDIYLMKLFYPYEMSPLYPYPASLDWHFLVAPLGFFFALAMVILAIIKDNRAVVFAFSFFFLNVVFVLQIVGAGQGFLADRFTYIPYLGLFFGFAYGIDWLFKNNHGAKSIALFISVMFSLVFAYLTFQQNKIWADGKSLWEHVLTIYPDSDMANNNRARFIRERQKNSLEERNADFKEAEAGFKKALSIKASPEVYNSLGKTYFDMSSGPEYTNKALTNYSAALALPLDKLDAKAKGEIYINRGAAYGRLSEELQDKSYLQRAAEDVKKGSELDPKNDNAFLNGYLISSQLGDHKTAIENIDKYNVLKPGEADMYYSRGLENSALQNFSQALQDYNQAIAFGPETIRKAKNAQQREEKTRYLGIFYFERAKLNVNLGNLPAAKSDLMQIEKYGLTIPPEMAKYVQ